MRKSLEEQLENIILRKMKKSEMMDEMKRLTRKWFEAIKLIL